MSRPRRDYDREFRDGAVRIVKETGRSVAHIARELGVNEGTLGNWVRRDRDERSGGPSWPGCAAGSPSRGMERDVLKRSVVLWVNEATR